MLNRNCQKCNQSFNIYPSRIRIGKGKYCSKKCSDSANLIKKGATPWIKGKHLRLSPKTEFKKGMTPWNKGKEMPSLKGHTHGFRKGIKPWNKNLKLDYKPHLKQRGKMAGSNNPQWKGGVYPLHMRFRKSGEYREWRKAVFSRDNYTCQKCFKKGIYLEADHIKPFANYPKLRLDINNGKTLCKSCHNKKTSIDMVEMWIDRRV